MKSQHTFFYITFSICSGQSCEGVFALFSPHSCLTNLLPHSQLCGYQLTSTIQSHSGTDSPNYSHQCTFTSEIYASEMWAGPSKIDPASEAMSKKLGSHILSTPEQECDSALPSIPVSPGILSTLDDAPHNLWLTSTFRGKSALYLVNWRHFIWCMSGAVPTTSRKRRTAVNRPSTMKCHEWVVHCSCLFFD